MVIEEIFDEVEVVPDAGSFVVSGLNLCDAVDALKQQLPFPPGDGRYSHFSVVPSVVDGRTVLSVDYTFGPLSCVESSKKDFASPEQMYSDLLLVLIVQKYKAGEPLHIEEAIHADSVACFGRSSKAVTRIAQEYDEATRKYLFSSD